MVVVFHSQSDLEKLWASVKGNLFGDVAYQFYGVIQIYPCTRGSQPPSKLQEQFGEKFAQVDFNNYQLFSSYGSYARSGHLWKEEELGEDIQGRTSGEFSQILGI